MHKKAMKAQKESFQLKLKYIREKVQLLTLEIKALKILAQQLACKTLSVKIVVLSKSKS